jgi:sodium-dependent dicarboxylate transporter 2/3/5
MGSQPAPVGLLQYSLGSAPASLAALLVAALVLRWVFPPEGIDPVPAVKRLGEKVDLMGRMSDSERWSIAVISLMVVSLVLGRDQGLGTWALFFSGVLFCLGILKWNDAEKYVNWGIVLLYGGAIAVGTAVHQSGAAGWLVEQVVSPDGPPLLVLACIGVVSSVLTEMVSNSAVIAVVLPVSLEVAQQVGLDPLLLAWLVPVCAGFAHVLPTSTPALAMVFATGYLKTSDTVPGLIVSLLGLAAFLAMMVLLWPLMGSLGLPEMP